VDNIQTPTNRVKIEIMEPRGVLVDPGREGLSNPRLTDLNGKTIALLGLYGGAESRPLLGSLIFFDILEQMLTSAYPTLKCVRFPSFGAPNAVVNADEIAASCDAWVEGVKDAITQGRRDVGVYMERAGKPGVSICSEVLLRSKRALADLNGMPAARLVTVPATDFCAAKRNRELMEPVVRAAFDDIVKALTTPLTEEEKRSYDMPYDYSPKTFEGETYTEAYEKFFQYCADNALSDGLPVVPPTKEAVEWMLTGTSYERDRVIGIMYPKRGIATVEKIAISAVMAGAKPEYLPVIIAMIETITAKNFNQFHIVNEILPAFFISGPIIKELGINNKIGYLAPGHRINSTIGRSVLMCMINIGWRDMTIYSSPGGPGQPAAYANYVIAENQDENPWESWAEQNGFGPDESIVTACEINAVVRGPAEVTNDDTYEQRLGLVRNAFSWRAMWGMPEKAVDYRHMLVLHPSFARQLALEGFTKQSFVRYLYDENALDWDKMTGEQREQLKIEVEKATAGKGKAMYSFTKDDVKPGLHREPFSDPANVMVMVSGTGAGNTIIFQAIAGSTGPNAEDVEEPRPFMSKVIRGATLTKYGR